MRPRDPAESHRAATPLELFFDLVFVVAIAQAASGLHHAIADGHGLTGLGHYLMVFFAIWWAWMNFTWFASAYDNEDVPYRLTVFLQLAGALVLAAGVESAMYSLDFTAATIGFTIMRVALVVQWLRAGRSDPPRRTATRRYASGLVVVQAGWVGLLFVPPALSLAGFLFLIAVELAIPVWAESAARTPWHPHHIAERYGLLTIIVLGESILAATVVIQSALSEGEALGGMLTTILGGLMILFSMWWLYFDHPTDGLPTDQRRLFLWGYGHYVVFASAAAVGAGIAVVTDVITHHAEITAQQAAWAVAIPVAIYVACVWVLYRLPRAGNAVTDGLAVVTIGLVLAMPFTPNPTLAVGAVLVGLIAIKIMLRERGGAGQGAGAI